VTLFVTGSLGSCPTRSAEQLHCSVDVIIAEAIGLSQVSAGRIHEFMPQVARRDPVAPAG
jgi:hypothetical protein